MRIEYTDQLALEFDELWGNLRVREEPYGEIVRTYARREEMTKKYAWAIPTEDALGCIAKFAPLVEMGAGTGYWAYELRKRGVEMHAYDQYPPDGSEWSEQERKDFENIRKNWYHRGHTTWTEVLPGTPKVLRDYDRSWNLFLCWPPYDTDMAAYSLGYFRGEYICYVGEDSGGCNGDKMFWRLLRRLFEEVESAPIPQWPGMHDHLTVYKRR